MNKRKIMSWKKKSLHTRTLYNGPFVLPEHQVKGDQHKRNVQTIQTHTGIEGIHFSPLRHQPNGQCEKRQFLSHCTEERRSSFQTRASHNLHLKSLHPGHVQLMKCHPDSLRQLRHTMNGLEMLSPFQSPQNIMPENHLAQVTCLTYNPQLQKLKPVRQEFPDNPCYPVCNLSFLNDSSEDRMDMNYSRGRCDEARCFRSAENSSSFIERDLNNNLPVNSRHGESCLSSDSFIFSGLESVVDTGQCTMGKAVDFGNNDSLCGIDLIEEILKPVHVRWRKAAHGYVREYLMDSESDSQASSGFFRSSPTSHTNSEKERKFGEYGDSLSVSPIAGNQDHHLNFPSTPLKNRQQRMVFNSPSSMPLQTFKLAKQTGRMDDRWARGPRKRQGNPTKHGGCDPSFPKLLRDHRSNGRYLPHDRHPCHPSLDRHPYHYPDHLPLDRHPYHYRDHPPLLPLPPPFPYHPEDHLERYSRYPRDLDVPPFPALDPLFDLFDPLPPLLPRRRGRPLRNTDWRTDESWANHREQDFTKDLDIYHFNSRTAENQIRGNGHLRGRTLSRGRPQSRCQLVNRGRVYGQQHAERGRGSLRNDRRNSRDRGRRRGNGDQLSRNTKTTPVAQVNNQQKEGDMDKVLPVETLQRFVSKLKEFPEKENAIQTIENCITATHIPIRTNFTVEELAPNSTKKPIFSGVLYLDDIFIQRSLSTSKKLLKHTVYKNALHVLKTKSVADIMAQTDTPLDIEQWTEPAVTQPSLANVEAEDFPQKLLKLQLKIKASRHPADQPVMLFDGAIMESRCGLSRDYSVEAIRTERGVPMYAKTTLLVDGKVLVSAVALSKKESKTRVCQKAINMFLTKTVEEIVKECCGNGESEQEIPQVIQEMIKKHRENQQATKTSAALTEQELGDLLDKMISDLKTPYKDGVNTIMTIDKNCVQLRIKLLAVYKTMRSEEDKTFITCDLYIVDRFIAQGKGTTRKQAQTDAYNKGAEVLKKSKGIDVLTSFPKFQDSELKDTNVMDIAYKGYSKVYESNLCRLNRLKQLPEEKRKVSELIIIEHEDWVEDRKKHAHCIICQSATQCGCLLEWTTEPENGCFRCSLKLQGQELASVIARQRKMALNLASAIALFNLYETQPVVQGFHADYPKIWTTRQELVEMSTMLDAGEESIKTCVTDRVGEVDKKIAKAMEQKLDQFFSQPTLMEFVAAPDWKPEEKRFLRMLATSRGLRITVENYCEEQLPVASKKYNLLEMVSILEQQPSKSQGRYRLLPAEAKPSYNDIAGEIAANESLVKTFGVTPDPSNQDKDLAAVCAAEELENDDNDDDLDISLDESETGVFVTANNTFNCDSQDQESVVKAETVPPIILSEIPLPKSTSTPSNTPNSKAENATKTDSSKAKNSKPSSRWDMTPEKYKSSQPPTQPQEISTAAYKTPTQLKSEPTSPLSLSSSSSFVSSGLLTGPKNPSDPSPAQLSDQIWTETSSCNGTGYEWQYSAAPQIATQAQLQPQASVQNRSFDVEAGLGRPWSHYEQAASSSNQYSAMPPPPPPPPPPLPQRQNDQWQQQQEQQHYHQGFQNGVQHPVRRRTFPTIFRTYSEI